MANVDEPFFKCILDKRGTGSKSLCSQKTLWSGHLNLGSYQIKGHIV